MFIGVENSQDCKGLTSEQGYLAEMNKSFLRGLAEKVDFSSVNCYICMMSASQNQCLLHFRFPQSSRNSQRCETLIDPRAESDLTYFRYLTLYIVFSFLRVFIVLCCILVWY